MCIWHSAEEKFVIKCAPKILCLPTMVEAHSGFWNRPPIQYLSTCHKADSSAHKIEQDGVAYL